MIMTPYAGPSLSLQLKGHADFWHPTVRRAEAMRKLSGVDTEHRGELEEPALRNPEAR
jgi:hypothetical protein